MKAKHIDPSEATGAELKAKNLIDNFIKDMEALKGKDSIIGVTVVNDSAFQTVTNTTTEYMPVIIGSFLMIMQNKHTITYGFFKTIINQALEFSNEVLSKQMMHLYQTIKNNSEKIKNEL